MKIKKVISTVSVGLILAISSFSIPNFSEAANYKLASFNTIRDISISDPEKEAGIINFNEFQRIYAYNYLSNKSPEEKNKSLYKLNSDISHLKYSQQVSNPDRQPPVILHWTAASNAMGVIKTLFQERPSMDEGIIGVDYVVSEPLYHPDYPDRPARSYAIKFSRSDVATTWFHVPDKYKGTMGEYDRKYNKAINIEIVGWRFLPNEKGKKNDFGKSGKLGIRETFQGDFEDMDAKYVTYPTVLRLVNYLAEMHNFADLIDNFTPEEEIDQNLKEKKGIIYLNGPLSKYLKGHGLVALEHTLLFNSDYRSMRSDFTPEELLVFYSDIKEYRAFAGNDMIAKNIEERLNIPVPLNSVERADLKEQIKLVKSSKKRDYLSYGIYLDELKIDSVAKLNEARKDIEFLDKKDKEKLTSKLLNKYLNESESVEYGDYGYLRSVIGTVRDSIIRERLFQILTDRVTYQNKVKRSS
jgi:hypothetical protein